MQVGDQTIRYDREATAAIYAGLDGGWAERCGCVGCRNLLMQREAIYPQPFRELLDRLGIDPNKEAEAVAYGPLKDGWHHYCGWFFLVGEIVAAGEEMSHAGDAPHFEYHFSRIGPCPKAFRDGPKICVEFDAHFKWILNESWDSKLLSPASANSTFPLES